MRYPSLNPAYSNAVEIRMGSPYRTAELTLEGSWIPDLPDVEWQDLYAESDNKRYLLLVGWLISPRDEPGFCFVLIDKKNKVCTQSDRISGCCKAVRFNGTRICYELFDSVDVLDLETSRARLNKEA